MDIDSAMAAIEERDGVLTGPQRAPANLAADAAGSIHDDTTAQKLGFRGGTVAGSVHMQQFPPMPPSEMLDANFKAAVDESDAALKALEHLRAETPPAAPNPEAIDAANQAMQEAEGRLGALEAAAIAGQVYDRSRAKVEKEQARYADMGTLVDRLRELVREVADEAIKPVLERSNAMLGGRLTLGYSSEDGIRAEYGDDEARPVCELSTGERFMVGVTLQASIAVELGIGMALVDDASVWDPDTQRWMLEAMVAIGREHEVTWVVVSAQPAPTVERIVDGVPVKMPIDGVLVVPLEGGYNA